MAVQSGEKTSWGNGSEYPTIYIGFQHHPRWLGMGFQPSTVGTWRFWPFFLENKIIGNKKNIRPKHKTFNKSPKMVEWVICGCWFPKIGVVLPPKSCHFNRVFPYFHHPFWETPIFLSSEIRIRISWTSTARCFSFSKGVFSGSSRKFSEGYLFFCCHVTWCHLLKHEMLMRIKETTPDQCQHRLSCKKFDGKSPLPPNL